MMPDSHTRYLEMKKKIERSSLANSNKLLKNVDNNKGVTEFTSFLTELNLANILLEKNLENFTYEPQRGIDFIFNDLAVSVKNLQPKNYEKKEQQYIEEIQAKGGGNHTFTHKGFSSIQLNVGSRAIESYWERIEMGHNNLLDSDLEQMSAPMRYIGEFEQLKIDKHKKILFFFIQSEGFKHYHCADIAGWYFNDKNYKYHIFQTNMGWYDKLLGQIKNNTIDGLIFMFRPQDILFWPPGCMNDVRDGKPRLNIYSREQAISEQLEIYFEASVGTELE